jgi:hypothetical protein
LAESSGKSAVVEALAADGKRCMLVGDGATDMATQDVVRLFVGFAGAERRPAVVEGAAVLIEGPGLAAVLPLALSSHSAAKLLDTPYWQVFEDGVSAIENGRVLFKDEDRRRRVLQAHRRASEAEQVFGD